MTGTLDDLATPCVLVDDERMCENIRRMQEQADSWQVRLRPHVKTHKSPELAKEQLAVGARGITVATVSEAEAFVQAGIDDVCIAYTLVGDDRLERIARIATRARVSFCVDSEEGARQASGFFTANGSVADVLVEIDTGHGRCGMPWEGLAVVEFCRFLLTLPGLRVRGLLTHAGQAYAGPAANEDRTDALKRVADEERDRLLDVAVSLREAGLWEDSPDDRERTAVGPVLSVGSTPTMAAFEPVSRGGLRINEIRPGNYIFNDAMQWALGSARLEACALTVLATVVSKHRDRFGRERVFIDAGKKVLTTDQGYETTGYGVPLYSASTMTPLPHAVLENLSEEHGWVSVSGGSTLSVGDRIRIVPNHACVVVATRRKLYRVKGDEVVGELTVFDG